MGKPGVWVLSLSGLGGGVGVCPAVLLVSGLALGVNRKLSLAVEVAIGVSDLAIGVLFAYMHMLAR